MSLLGRIVGFFLWSLILGVFGCRIWFFWRTSLEQVFFRGLEFSVFSRFSEQRGFQLLWGSNFWNVWIFPGDLIPTLLIFLVSGLALIFMSAVRFWFFLTRFLQRGF